MLHAQVFIPTQLERDWLNDLIPGVVNGDGIMDTLHVGIETLSAATLDASIPEGTTLVLEGLRYLDSLHTFVFNMPYTSGTAIFIEIPGVPGNLRSMQFFR